jgi:hypothetical protein
MPFAPPAPDEVQTDSASAFSPPSPTEVDTKVNPFVPPKAHEVEDTPQVKANLDKQSVEESDMAFSRGMSKLTAIVKPRESLVPKSAVDFIGKWSLPGEAEQIANKLGMTKTAKVAGGLREATQDLVEFFTSIPGITMTVAGGGLPAAGKRAMAGAFTTYIAANAPEQWKAIQNAWQRGDTKEVTRIAANNVVNFTAAYQGGKFAIKGVEPVVAPKTKAEAIAPVAPLTAEALKQAEATPMENPGGALKDLPPEKQTKSNAVKDAMKAQFEALKAQTEKPPAVEGVRFDSKIEAGGKKLWQFTVQDNGPAHNAGFTVPVGSPESVIRAKVDALVKARTEIPPVSTTPAASPEIPHSPLAHVEGEVGAIKLKSTHEGTSNDAYGEAYARLQKLRPELFKPNGSAPDQVVQSLNDAGFRNVTTDNLFDTLLANHNEQVNIGAGKTPEARANKFQEAIQKNAQKPSAEPVSVAEMAIGTKFRIGGEEFTVKDINPDTGEVTVDDGRKFQRQQIPDGAILHVDKGSHEPAVEGSFQPEGKPTIQPKLGQGQKQGDLIASTQTEDFALTGEKGTDAERLQAAKENAARDSAEAKRIQDKQQQTLLPAGPGAATRPDLVTGPDLPVNPGNPDIYGVAERVRAERAAAGQVAPVPRGEGIAAPDSVEHGQELIASGADPQKIMSDFEKTKRLSADDMAVARAHGEKLFQTARKIESQFGTDSPEWRAAFDAGSKWDARSKVMQTEWHKTGQAQQGETDLDTGSFTGLQRAFKESTGKEFTPGQAIKAKEIVKRVHSANAANEGAQGRLFAELEKQIPKVGEAQKVVWERVKGYIEQGADDFDDIRNKVATDLGMKTDDVTRLISQNKTVKRLADDVWNKQQTARQMKDWAKRWVTDQAVPGYRRALAKIPRWMFSLKVGFHGTVALGTHAPMVAFQPRFWETYTRDFGKMYKMVGSPTYYENQIQDLVRRPNYITARRAGLINDPYSYEDFNNPGISQYFGRLTGMGNRGYSVLKILRQDMFDQMWSKLPKTSQIPEVAEAIADGLNHATGVVKGKAPKGANIALFAPRLEASRVMWLAGDPIRAVKAFADWKNADLGEKTFAINQVKEKAVVAGTMFTLLAINQGFLSATGSKQKINMTDPMKSDFLKFKVAGVDISYGNPMITMARLPVRLAAIREKGGSGKLAKLIYPDESMANEVVKYVRSQLSPFASAVADIATKGDYANRPLPKMPLSGAQLPMPKRLASQGVKPYTWPELTIEQVLPIPAEEAVRDVWAKGMGMSSKQMKEYWTALAKAMVMGATGSRINDDYELKHPSQPPVDTNAVAGQP